MEKPLTTSDLFNIIVKKLEEKGKLPDILDYHLGDGDKLIKTSDWHLYGKVNFGGNEGIYLDIYLEGYLDNPCDKNTIFQDIHIGTFKTLYDDYNSFVTMSILNADFIFEEISFYRENSRIFEWLGYNVDCYSNGALKHSWFQYGLPNTEEPIFKDDTFDFFVITDMVTRKHMLIDGAKEV